jgi:hypothetical protein
MMIADINSNEKEVNLNAKSDALRFALVLNIWEPIFCGEYFHDIKGLLLYILLPAIIIYLSYYAFAYHEMRKGNKRMTKIWHFYVPAIMLECLIALALFVFNKVWIIPLGVVLLFCFTLVYFKRRSF